VRPEEVAKAHEGLDGLDKGKVFDVRPEEVAQAHEGLDGLGGLASFIALSLFFPGFIPSGVRVKPR